MLSWGRGYTDGLSQVFDIGMVKLSVGGHVMVLHSSGVLYAWGANDAGQLGIGPAKATDQGMPTPVSGC
jgi:alpha-tubulin suppressor-like RCC1 family protein